MKRIKSIGWFSLLSKFLWLSCLFLVLYSPQVYVSGSSRKWNSNNKAETSQSYYTKIKPKYFVAATGIACVVAGICITYFYPQKGGKITIVTEPEDPFQAEINEIHLEIYKEGMTHQTEEDAIKDFKEDVKDYLAYKKTPVSEVSKGVAVDETGNPFSGENNSIVLMKEDHENNKNYKKAISWLYVRHLQKWEKRYLEEAAHVLSTQEDFDRLSKKMKGIIDTVDPKQKEAIEVLYRNVITNMKNMATHANNLTKYLRAEKAEEFLSKEKTVTNMRNYSSDEVYNFISSIYRCLNEMYTSYSEAQRQQVKFFNEISSWMKNLDGEYKELENIYQEYNKMFNEIKEEVKIVRGLYEYLKEMKKYFYDLHTKRTNELFLKEKHLSFLEGRFSSSLHDHYATCLNEIERDFTAFDEDIQGIEEVMSNMSKTLEEYKIDKKDNDSNLIKKAQSWKKRIYQTIHTAKYLMPRLRHFVARKEGIFAKGTVKKPNNVQGNPWFEYDNSYFNRIYRDMRIGTFASVNIYTQDIEDVLHNRHELLINDRVEDKAIVNVPIFQKILIKIYRYEDTINQYNCSLFDQNTLPFKTKLKKMYEIYDIANKAIKEKSRNS